MLSTTAFLAIAMQCAASIHPSTAFDVARVESGFNPYAIAEIVPKAGPSFGDQHIISHLPASQPGRCRAYSPSPVSTGSPLLCRADANHQHQFPPLWCVRHRAA